MSAATSKASPVTFPASDFCRPEWSCRTMTFILLSPPKVRRHLLYPSVSCSSSLIQVSLASSMSVPTTSSIVPPLSTRLKKLDSPASASDQISLLNELIRKSERRPPMMDSKEADRYIQLVKEKQLKGLQKLKGEGTPNGQTFSYKVDPYSLRPGDYVVHKKAGIGRFVSIKTDVHKDSAEPIEYVFLEYADGMAKLPVAQASRLLYRYNLPKETAKPRALSKLSDPSAWEKRRIKGKIAVQKMVVDLMELYLHRLKQRRTCYPKPPAMDVFVSRFLYEPTPDQKQAFIDVEKDLTERQTPMDRLICGDVGFGKTEVALRAIYCVVSAGKQAMVLAPTIVLAKQHYDVISDRFSGYPEVTVGLLSRFQV